MEVILPIAKPPWTNLGRGLESAVRKALFDFNMIENEKIAIALSGGKDSLSLLYLLKAISGKGFPKFDLHAIYVKGDYSCGANINENFLKAICEELEVNFIVKNSVVNEKKLECYNCSRERRKLIFDAAKDVGAKTIAFGHHRDDNIQTLFLNLLHKGEFAGLLPKIKMIHYGVTIIRPLIYIKEKELINFAEAYGFKRITCQCPKGQNSKRKTTDNLITLIEEKFPNARTNLSHAALNYGSAKAQRK